MRGAAPVPRIHICDTIDYKPVDTNDTITDINAIVYDSEAVVVWHYPLLFADRMSHWCAGSGLGI